jgi:hypothetical protein
MTPRDEERTAVVTLASLGNGFGCPGGRRRVVLRARRQQEQPLADGWDQLQAAGLGVQVAGAAVPGRPRECPVEGPKVASGREPRPQGPGGHVALLGAWMCASRIDAEMPSGQRSAL